MKKIFKYGDVSLVIDEEKITGSAALFGIKSLLIGKHLKKENIVREFSKLFNLTDPIELELFTSIVVNYAIDCYEKIEVEETD